MTEFYCVKTRRLIKSHCYVGHEYTPENTGTASSGGRFCKSCERTNGRIRLRNFRIREALAYSQKP